MQLLNKVLAFGAVSILLTGCPEKKDPDKDVSAEDSKAAGYTAPDIKSEESGAKKPVDVTPPSETAAGKAPVTAPAKQILTGFGKKCFSVLSRNDDVQTLRSTNCKCTHKYLK